MERGVIREFRIYLTLAHTGADILLAILSTDGAAIDDAFLDTIGAHSLVWAVIYLSNQQILVFGEYPAAQELAELGKFLRGLQGITNVEMHTLVYEKGSACEYDQYDRKVLKCLATNARMPINEIAQKTRLTPRRVRKVMGKFLGEGDGGSTPEFFTLMSPEGDARTSQACIHFRVIWNLNAAGRTSFFIRVDWAEEQTTARDLVKWLDTKFPIDFWYALNSATGPTLFCLFAVEHLRDAETITRAISQNPFVTSVDLLIGYPTKWYPSAREILLEKLITDVDLSS